MEHELFRHIEIELFVTRSRLAPALAFVRETIQWFGDEGTGSDQEIQRRLAEIGLLEPFRAARGTYTHHYAICIRRVLADDTLISMTSGSPETCYAISLISYARPAERAGFFRFAQFLAASMGRLFDARPHWGKVCPLSAQEAERLYPRLDDFRTICRRLDPQGAFQNGWTSRIVGGSLAAAH